MDDYTPGAVWVILILASAVGFKCRELGVEGGFVGLLVVWVVMAVAIFWGRQG